MLAIAQAHPPQAVPPPRASDLDAASLARAAAGEPQACRQLIRRYRRPVGALLRRMLGPAGLDDLTEDLAQETFLRAFRALPRFDPTGPARLSTWLLRIAARLAINELERRRPRLVAVPCDTLADAGGADALARRRRIAGAIQQAVAELPPAFRAAFILREYHDLEYAEIAEALELDVGTVRSRLHRARHRLRATLKELRDE